MPNAERVTVTLRADLVAEIDRVERNRSRFIAEAVERDLQRRRHVPCIAVSDPSVNMAQRFPLIAVVPVTGTVGTGALYPVLTPGASGLVKQSSALIDHLRSIDKRRICRIFGRISAPELAAIDQGLELFLGLNAHT